QGGDVVLVLLDLPLDPFHQGAILFEPHAPVLELIDHPVILVLQLGDRVGSREDVRDLVQPSLEGPPELPQDHGCYSLDSASPGEGGAVVPITRPGTTITSVRTELHSLAHERRKKTPLRQTLRGPGGRGLEGGGARCRPSDWKTRTIRTPSFKKCLRTSRRPRKSTSSRRSGGPGRPPRRIYTCAGRGSR